MSASTIEYGQLPAMLLRAPDGAEATITLYGAHLVSWRPARSAGRERQPGEAGPERLFMSSLSALDGSRAIRGGVPVIFPQFAERGEGMRHGFARVSTWRVLDSGEQDGAAFAVLKAPDIPSILVETAFISNPEEEARLKDDAYQNQLADAITKGIKRYFAYNPPLAKSRMT